MGSTNLSVPPTENPDEWIVQLVGYQSSFSKNFGIHQKFNVYDPDKESWETWEVRSNSNLSDGVCSYTLTWDPTIKFNHSDSNNKTYSYYSREKCWKSRVYTKWYWKNFYHLAAPEQNIYEELEEYKEIKIDPNFDLYHEIEGKHYATHKAYLETSDPKIHLGNLLDKNKLQEIHPNYILRKVTYNKIDRSINHSYSTFPGIYLFGEWYGKEAKLLVNVLNKPFDYPYENYRVWPGPNSNTYIDWVIREAGVSCDLHPMAVGKDFKWLHVGLSRTRTGFNITPLPILGVTLGIQDGIELNFVGLTFGIDFYPPALKTPYGRIGAVE